MFCLMTCLSSCNIHYYGMPYYEDIRGSYCSDVIYIERPLVLYKDKSFYVCDSSMLGSVVNNDTINNLSFVHPLLSDGKIVSKDFSSPFHPYTTINYLRYQIFKKQWQLVVKNEQYLDERCFQLIGCVDTVSIFSFKEIPSAFLLLFVPLDREKKWIEDICIGVKSREYVIELLPLYTRKQRFRLNLHMSNAISRRSDAPFDQYNTQTL